MNAALLVIKGAISEMEPEDQQRVKDMADQIRQIINSDRVHGLIALALVGCEEQENA